MNKVSVWGCIKCWLLARRTERESPLDDEISGENWVAADTLHPQMDFST